MSRDNTHLSANNSLFFLVILLLLAIPAMAQEEKEPVFMFAPLAEYSLYGGENHAIGAGFSIANDGRVAIGMSFIYFHEVARTEIMEKRILGFEMLFFIRYYFLDKLCTGPFLQFSGGPLVLFTEDNIHLPSSSGAFTAGLIFGWRIPLGKLFYLEPYVRGGYPFIVGGGLSLGFRL